MIWHVYFATTNLYMVSSMPETIVLIAPLTYEAMKKPLVLLQNMNYGSTAHFLQVGVRKGLTWKTGEFNPGESNLRIPSSAISISCAHVVSCDVELKAKLMSARGYNT